MENQSILEKSWNNGQERFTGTDSCIEAKEAKQALS